MFDVPCISFMYLSIKYGLHMAFLRSRKDSVMTIEILLRGLQLHKITETYYEIYVH